MTIGFLFEFFCLIKLEPSEESDFFLGGERGGSELLLGGIYGSSDFFLEEEEGCKLFIFELSEILSPLELLFPLAFLLLLKASMPGSGSLYSFCFFFLIVLEFSLIINCFASFLSIRGA